ncbi:MAG: glycine dehydrogenase (aminomethyl-transferring), partial [Bacteroidia bacterium]
MKSDLFSQRHLGPRQSEIKEMLETIGVGTMDELVSRTIPKAILRSQFMNLPDAMDEHSYLERMREIAGRNLRFRTYMGLGFYNTILPPVIQRNILENPNWYTSYTPYQAEISQGRLEALLNYQTVIMELTGLEIANASLLDESSAAAEAMIMLFNARSRSAVKEGRNNFFVDENIFPQTKAVLITRAESLGIELIFGSYREVELDGSMFGSLIQYPAADGEIRDYSAFTASAHEKEIAVAVAADLMSLVLI